MFRDSGRPKFPKQILSSRPNTKGFLKPQNGFFLLGPGPWGPWAHGPRPLGPIGIIFNSFGPGAGAGSPWARGLGAPGPKLQDTGFQPLSEMHPITAYMHPRVSADMHPTSAYFAPNNRIPCTQPFPHTCTQNPHTCTQKSPYRCTQQPHTLHPTVSAYMHPNSANMHPIVYAYMHQIFRIFMFLKMCNMVQDLSRSVPRVFRSPGNPSINLFH